MKAKAAFLAFAIAGVIIFLFIASRASSERVEVRQAINNERLKLAATASRHLETGRLISLVNERESELDRLSDEANSPTGLLSIQSKRDQDGLFETWIIRIDNLATFLSEHDSFQIPELKYLTANDWLEATISESLETEADYRSTAARLRILAKQKVAPEISAALAAYLESSGGKLPSNARDLLPKLEGKVSPAVLDRYRVNPSGLIDGRNMGMTQILVEDQLVDPIWNSRFSFSDHAHAYAMYGSPDHSYVTDAISTFQAENGRPPANSEELAPYVKSKTIRDNLAEIMRAMATPVSYQ